MKTVNDPPPFSRKIDILFIDYRSTAYYVKPLITLFFRDKMQNVITRICCTVCLVIFFCSTLSVQY